MKNLLSILTLFLCLTACSTHKAESPSIIEITDLDYRLSSKGLNAFCTKNDIDTTSVYKWENHWVIYSQFEHIENFKSQLEAKYPRIKINIFNKPFYSFNRQKQCHQEPAKQWDNIIMTANLVSDTAKQKEYMEYHRTQFEKWPEVSKGFCNASFQQLLVFRTGRQLMLIISIPKGKTLDELNPKTTENNPRVNEWNSIMSKYQEGIEDAPKGTTWVMFKSLR